MVAEALIGVDLGTSVVKTTLFDVAGRSLAAATRDAPLHQPAPGIAEQQGEDFLAATYATIREVVEKSGIAPGAVAAIAFDGQMAGAIGIDRDWNALTPWYPSALDSRYQPYVARMQALVGDELLARNGAFPFMAPRMLWWQEQFPALYQRIDKVLILANFVAGKMAGLRSEEAFVDPSYLTWTGVSDTARRTWSPELAAACGIDLAKLPRIVPSVSIVGHLSPQRPPRAGCGPVCRWWPGRGTRWPASSAPGWWTQGNWWMWPAPFLCWRHARTHFLPTPATPCCSRSPAR